jgi:hypothetical protein
MQSPPCCPSDPKVNMQIVVPVFNNVTGFVFKHADIPAEATTITFKPLSAAQACQQG